MPDEAAASVLPGTPRQPRKSVGASPWALGDPDGSPLPTPPRVSHIYESTSPRSPVRSASSPAAPGPAARSDACLTPGVPGVARAPPRSVGQSLRKLRMCRNSRELSANLAGAVRTGATLGPARRVQRYEDEEEEDTATERPPADQAAPEHGRPAETTSPKEQPLGKPSSEERPAGKASPTEGGARGGLGAGEAPRTAGPRAVSEPSPELEFPPAGEPQVSPRLMPERPPAPRPFSPAAPAATIPEQAPPAPRSPTRPSEAAPPGARKAMHESFAANVPAPTQGGPDGKERDDAARMPPPPTLPMPVRGAPAPPPPEPADKFLTRLWEEAERQRATGYTPVIRPGQKTLAKETTFRGCRFIKVRRAGEGGFSTVWHVRGPTAIPTGTAEDSALAAVDEAQQGHYAMKQVSLKRLEEQSRQELIQEAELLEQLAHKPGNGRYILRYFGHRLNRDTLKIILELGDTDFSHVLRTDHPLPREQLCEYWRQMLEAVHFVHEVGNLVHTDLKPANFLLVRGRLKLIDFGIAQKIPLGTIHISRDAIVGTPNYMAPEAIKIAKAHGRRVYKAGKASDVWSLGCILYQMVYGRPPFDRLPPDRKLEAIIDPNHAIAFPPHRNLDDPTSERVDEELLATMRSVLCYDATRRATIPELLRDPLLGGFLHETVTVSRQTLRELVARLRLRTVQGELTEENVLERADALFANLRDAASRTPAAGPAPHAGPTT